MPPRTWLIRVSDMLDAIAKIYRYTGGMTFEEFSSDEKTIDAVVRNLGVIGEAARYIPDSVRNGYPEIPWSAIVGMRNFVIHQYSGVSLTTVWATLKDDLPPLEAVLNVIRLTADDDDHP